MQTEPGGRRRSVFWNSGSQTDEACAADVTPLSATVGHGKLSLLIYVCVVVHVFTLHPSRSHTQSVSVLFLNRLWARLTLSASHHCRQSSPFVVRVSRIVVHVVLDVLISVVVHLHIGCCPLPISVWTH